MPDREITPATVKASGMMVAFMQDLFLFPADFKFPSHFDLNKVHEELSRSNTSTYYLHPSGMEFGAILLEIQAWKDKGVNWAECGPFPKFGDHNNLLVQKILLWGCD